MNALRAEDLLRTWEQGHGAPEPERALLLLGLLRPEACREELAELPLGTRDMGLLELRELLFGTQLSSLGACPHCTEPIELSLDTRDLRVPLASPEPRTEDVLDHRIHFRLPNSLDVLACAGFPPSEAEETLLRRCVIEVQHQGQSVPVTALPAAVTEALDARMAEADPGAELRFDMVCPACEKPWSTFLDLPSFLWTELQDWALRTLRDVHHLASAYGWREQDILALSPLRRRLYLEMAAP